MPPDKPKLGDLRSAVLGLGTKPAPGIPGTKLPPRLPPPVSQTADTPLPPVHARARAATQTGMPAPMAPSAAPGPPSAPLSPVVTSAPQPASAPVSQAPRSMSPAPSSSITVTTPDGSKLSIKTRLLRTLWLWVGPLVLSVLGTAYGYVRGYAKGLADAAERLAKIETRADAHAVRMAKVEERLESVENGLAQESASNRSERATAIARDAVQTKDIEQLKKSVPQIQGITPAK